MEGESLSDFDSCQCGGKLYLVEYGEESNIKSHNEGNVKIKSLNEEDTNIKSPNGEDIQIKSPKITCECCGNLNNVNTPFCSNCGQILMPAKEIGAENREHRNSSFKSIGVFAGLTFIVVSIMIVGLLV
jgi:hypothetical protein